jgi:3-hydroxyacyl-[acyl-carrier-protein] dehydratase
VRLPAETRPPLTTGPDRIGSPSTTMRLETFEMIDRVTLLDREGRRIEAEATVPLESPVFEGHFPGHPLMPGVLLTETMAQASGYLLLSLSDFTHMPFLMGVDKARFRSFVGPGARLAVRAALEHDGSGYAVTRARIEAEGKALCDAELRFRTMPFPEGLDGPMRARARAIGLVTEAG